MMRPVLVTFNMMTEKFKDREISVRKRFCLAYLEFAKGGRKSQTDKAKEKAVELAKEWRKTDKKAGGHRTKIERVIRAFFAEVALRKKLANSRAATSVSSKKIVAEGRGVNDPAFADRRLEILKAGRQKQIDQNLGCAMWWVVTDPEDKEIVVKSMARWCRENDINHRGLHATALHPTKRFKGHRIRKVNLELEDISNWEQYEFKHPL